MNKKRLYAFAIDFIITAFIQAIMFSMLMMVPLVKGEITNQSMLFAKALGITYISMLYLFFRDIPNTGSIGKMIMKLKIIDISTKENAKISQRILRNIFWVFGPLEIFVYAITGTKIGDRIAKTEVV